MQANYDKCLETILHHEGGYVNHPKDPGGETNLGVTKRVYEEHGGTIKPFNMKNVNSIYDNLDKENFKEKSNGLKRRGRVPSYAQVREKNCACVTSGRSTWLCSFVLAHGTPTFFKYMSKRRERDVQ